MCDVDSGETFAIGVTPPNIRDLLNGLQVLPPPVPGELLSEDGWQYYSADLAPDGSYAVYSALWSNGVNGARLASSACSCRARCGSRRTDQLERTRATSENNWGTVRLPDARQAVSSCVTRLQ